MGGGQECWQSAFLTCLQELLKLLVPKAMLSRAQLSGSNNGSRVGTSGLKDAWGLGKSMDLFQVSGELQAPRSSEDTDLGRDKGGCHGGSKEGKETD